MKWKWLIAAVVAIAVAIPLGTFVYINFIEDEPAERLTLDDAPNITSGDSSTQQSTTTVATATATDLSGNWKPTTASQVGYRVKEVLFGQDTEAVGRTNKVTGTLTIEDKTVSVADLSVDMTSVKSDQDNRDNQFRGRIMSTSDFPTASFKLTKPIEMSKVPDATPMNVKATGTLTLHGVSKTVTLDLKVQNAADGLRINGTFPITFDEWDIPNPTFGPAKVGDKGELELLVVFNKS